MTMHRSAKVWVLFLCLCAIQGWAFAADKLQIYQSHPLCSKVVDWFETSGKSPSSAKGLPLKKRPQPQIGSFGLGPQTEALFLHRQRGLSRSFPIKKMKDISIAEAFPFVLSSTATLWPELPKKFHKNCWAKHNGSAEISIVDEKNFEFEVYEVTFQNAMGESQAIVASRLGEIFILKEEDRYVSKKSWDLNEGDRLVTLGSVCTEVEETWGKSKQEFFQESNPSWYSNAVSKIPWTKGKMYNLILSMPSFYAKGHPSGWFVLVNSNLGSSAP